MGFVISKRSGVLSFLNDRIRWFSSYKRSLGNYRIKKRPAQQYPSFTPKSFQDTFAGHLSIFLENEKKRICNKLVGKQIFFFRSQFHLGFPKIVVPNNHGFSHWKWSFWGGDWRYWYHHLRKHPFGPQNHPKFIGFFPHGSRAPWHHPSAGKSLEVLTKEAGSKIFPMVGWFRWILLFPLKYGGQCFQHLFFLMGKNLLISFRGISLTSSLMFQKIFWNKFAWRWISSF